MKTGTYNKAGAKMPESRGFTVASLAPLAGERIVYNISNFEAMQYVRG